RVARKDVFDADEPMFHHECARDSILRRRTRHESLLGMVLSTMRRIQTRRLLRGIRQQKADSLGVELEQRASGGRRTEHRAERTRLVTLLPKIVPTSRTQRARAPVIAQLDGSQHGRTWEVIAFAYRERRRHHAGAWMRARRVMNIIGLIRMTEHAVCE